MSKPTSRSGGAGSGGVRAFHRTLYGHASLHQGTPQRPAPSALSVLSREQMQARLARWESDLHEFDLAFLHKMSWRVSRINIPATLRDWISTFRRLDSPPHPILYRRAAEQVATWMRTNRHLFPGLRIK